MDAPEAPHQHHAAHTGRRWLDISLAVSAMFVSVISLAVAVEHGRTMERMAEANTKMVEANSWPFVEFDSHDIDEQRNSAIRFVLTNVGVGPARIETFEMWYDGKPMSSLWDLLDACCAISPANPADWHRFLQKAPIGVGNAAPNILRAGDHENFVFLKYERDIDDLTDKIDQQRSKITTRTCYCSVFDECWRTPVTSSLTTNADKVASCPVPAVPFRTDVRAPHPE